MDQNIKEIITRILEENATVDDREALLEWIKLNDENRKQLEKIEGLWNAFEILRNREKFNPQKAYNQFVDISQHKIVKQSGSLQKKSTMHYWSLAASIILLLGFSVLLTKYMQRSIDEITYFELSTPNGSHTLLTLIDGSTVWLNAGSKLRYPNKFEGNTRTVYLDGEGYFNVKKDSKKPFIVETSQVKVKALGTSFNVKAYEKEGSIETTLIKGTVIVEDKDEVRKFSSVRLSPKQRVTFVKKSGKLLLGDNEKKLLKKQEEDIQTTERKKESLIVTENVNTQLYVSWVDNELLFENETFESIAYKLERRYGAFIVFQDEKMKNFRFSGKFPEISIEGVLNALQFASPFKYEIQKDTIIIN